MPLRHLDGISGVRIVKRTGRRIHPPVDLQRAEYFASVPDACNAATAEKLAHCPRNVSVKSWFT